MKLPAPVAASVILASLAASPVVADVVPAPLFQDHAVLQLGTPIPVWGTADEGERVTVTFNGKTAETVAKGGRWTVNLPPATAGGPYELTLEGKNRIVLRDILVGEVWLCGGQSNMERQLGLREGQKPIRNWESEVAGANFPHLRHFGAAQTLSLTPKSAVGGGWTVATPETAHDFTAVGFFFGRALHQARGVPVGLIHSSWGGTPAEAWMSSEGLDRVPEMAESVSLLRQLAADPAAAEATYASRINAWFLANDPGSAPAQPWSATELDVASWSTMAVPGLWESAGLPDVDALVWFRRDFDVPPSWVDSPIDLHLGKIDDADTTWINGVQVGTTNGYNTPRLYRVPPGVLKPGRNTLAIRVVDTGGGGGLWSAPGDLRLVNPAASGEAVNLAGDWRYRVALDFRDRSRPPTYLPGSPSAPTVLYNGMIAPLVPYAMRGAIWYQGEANASEPGLYRKFLPALVADWRGRWGLGDFPFLYVQIAPFRGMPPEIREAQRLSLPRISKSAMAVTIDVGDADDIHPADKRPVGERLALAARAVAYGEDVEYSGPLYRNLHVDGDRAVLHFDHVGLGLVAPGGTLRGFELSGADGRFHAADARVVGETVEVSAAGISTPTAVRYGWANVPDANLFNKNGLPASPFRTDAR